MFDKNEMWQDVANAKRIGICGHIRPDGDCIGSCLALYNYIKENYSCEVDVHAEEVPTDFMLLTGSECVQTVYPYMKEGYDVFFALDCSDAERLGKAERYLNEAKKTYCIDHHMTNNGYGTENLIAEGASSTCEIIYELFDTEKLNKGIAECLYLGIVHDTGVFKYSNTSRRTMEVAGALLEFGISTVDIIDGTFYEKTFLQNQILGRCLMESELFLDGKFAVTSIDRKVQALYNLQNGDSDGIVDQLRMTRGVEVAAILKEMNPRIWRVSLRSNHIVDVASICNRHNGGGHMRAAGCILEGTLKEAVDVLISEISEQL